MKCMIRTLNQLHVFAETEIIHPCKSNKCSVADMIYCKGRAQDTGGVPDRVPWYMQHSDRVLER